MGYLHTLLVLGRTSNLPTVWSNCLAGWWLGGGGTPGRFAVLCGGATCLYLGGMFLNDAFDTHFDREHRRERPIPSGAISPVTVWKWGFGWLLAGMLCLALLGQFTALLAALLTVNIIFYNAVHKQITFSPLIMAGCRFFLYLVAASAAVQGGSGLAIWSALALAAYIVGLSYLARFESVPGMLRYWPCLFLAGPILLAWLVNTGAYRLIGLVLSLLLAIWILRCLYFTYERSVRNIGRTVSGLLAGIVLVDMLAVAGGTPALSMLFVALFTAALLLQRFVPAT